MIQIDQQLGGLKLFGLLTPLIFTYNQLKIHLSKVLI